MREDDLDAEIEEMTEVLRDLQKRVGMLPPERLQVLRQDPAMRSVRKELLQVVRQSIARLEAMGDRLPPEGRSMLDGFRRYAAALTEH